METLNYNLSLALINGDITAAKQLKSEIKVLLDNKSKEAEISGMILEDMNTTEQIKQIFNFNLSNDAEFIKAINKYHEVLVNAYEERYDKLFLKKNNINYNLITKISNVVNVSMIIELDYISNIFINFYIFFIIIYTDKIKINPKYIFDKLKIMYENSYSRKMLENIAFVTILLFSLKTIVENKHNELVYSVEDLLTYPISYYNGEKNVTVTIDSETQANLYSFIKNNINMINDTMQYVYLPFIPSLNNFIVE